MDEQKLDQEPAPDVLTGENLDDLAREAAVEGEYIQGGEGQSPPEPEPQEPDSQLVTTLAAAIEGTVRAFAPRWARILDAQHAELQRHGVDAPPASVALADAWARVAALYLGDARPGPWTNALAVTLVCVAPLMGEPRYDPPPPKPKRDDSEPPA